MPVTIKPSPQLVGENRDRPVTTAQDLLLEKSKAWTTLDGDSDYAQTNKHNGPETRPILRSSFNGAAIFPYENGFVHGIIRAFEQDLHLVLRPDDVWLAIISQFSYFVDGNSEVMRRYFVAHEGKRELKMDLRPFSLEDLNVGVLAQWMTGLIQENVVDPTLQEWIMPKFSTTKDNDKSVAAIVMMGTLKGYFEYLFLCGCGFPSVTLLGEKEDWEEILRRVHRLPKYGEQTAEWSRLLVPVVEHMVMTFDEPESQQLKEFWLRVAHQTGSEGSSFGIETMSGWVTAFCYWDEDGKRIPEITEERLAKEEEYGGVPIAQRKRLVLNDIMFPIIRVANIPGSIVKVPVTVEDAGTGLRTRLEVVAGAVGTTNSDDGSLGDYPVTRVRPASGWWVLQDSVEPLSQDSSIKRVLAVPEALASTEQVPY